MLKKFAIKKQQNTSETFKTNFPQNIQSHNCSTYQCQQATVDANEKKNVELKGKLL